MTKKRARANNTASPVEHREAQEQKPHAPLKHQKRGERWHPGEIPAGPFMPVSMPHDKGTSFYGRPNFAVELAKNRGYAKPKKG